MIIQDKVLRVVSWKHPNAEELLKTDSDNPKIFGGGFYLHGKVEEYYHYDLCSFLDLPEEYTYLSELRNENRTPCRRISFTGIYNVEVVDYPGECLGFFWFGGEDKFNGLIVDKTDFPSLEYANECYINNEYFI